MSRTPRTTRLLGGAALLAGLALAFGTATVGAETPPASTTPTSPTSTTPTTTTPATVPCTAQAVRTRMWDQTRITYACTIGALGVRITDQPDHGTIMGVTQGDGVVHIDYRGDWRYIGPDSFTWSGGAGGPVTQPIEVFDDRPLECGVTSSLGGSSPFRLSEPEQLWLAVGCNSDDPTQAVQFLEGPAHGVLHETDDPRHIGLLYRPHAGYRGPDRFVLQMSDAHGRRSAPLAVEIEARGPNHPPSCPPRSLVAQPGELVTFDVGCTDADGDRLAYTFWGAVTPGAQLSLDGSRVGYRSAPGHRGYDRFTVQVYDGFDVVHVNVEVQVGTPEPAAPIPSPDGGGKKRATPTMPKPPKGFVPAAGVDLGPGISVWSPAVGVSLGRRGSAVLGAGCLQACVLQAELRLQPRGRQAVTLPSRTLRLGAGRRAVASMRLTAAARNATRRQRRVRAVLLLTVVSDDGPPQTRSVPLVVQVRKTPRPR